MVCKICNKPVDNVTDHWECGVERLRRLMNNITGSPGPSAPTPTATATMTTTNLHEPEPGIEPGDELRALVEVDLILWRNWYERHGCNCGQHLSNGTC